MSMRQSGFTVVELIVAIVVIGILASVGVVAYGNWRERAAEDQLQSDLKGASAAMESGRTFGTDYPSSLPSSYEPSDGVTMSVKGGGGTYCIEATAPASGSAIYSVKSGTKEILSKPCGTYFTALSAENPTVCGISYGKAYCWGAGASGNIGNGGIANASSPVAVNTSIMSGKVTNISGSCAVANEKAFCWGYNGGGRIGNGLTVDSYVPVAVATSTMPGTVTEISSNSDHTCAVVSGKAYCWGSNGYGQLGDGTTTSSSYPVAVSRSIMPGTVTSISVGSQHTCAVASGKAYCWGNGNYGATARGHLGNGTINTYATPTAVDTSLMSGVVTDISTSNTASTCAVADGKAYCWGEGSSGQLGNGGSTSTSSPVLVTATAMPGSVSSITNSCAVADGKAYCWGPGSGRIGNNSASGSTAPVAVVTTTMAEAVTNLSSYGSLSMPSCGIANGNLYCWGAGSSGQIGSGSTATVLVPTPVSQIP